MDISGERRIEAPREKVWAALNDPAILQACIPGCEAIEKLSDTALKATAAVKLGPIAARFTGTALLSNLDPPNGYTISGEGQAGVAGYIKGGATVALHDEMGTTRLTYNVNTQMGGKIAELDPWLVDTAALQYTESFFAQLVAIVAPMPAIHGPSIHRKAGTPPHHAPQADHDHDPSNPHYFGLPIGVIIAAAVAVISVGIVLAKFLP